LDTEDLDDLRELQLHVRKSHNLVLLLTSGVLKRPWVLVELVTAIKAGTRIVPVEVQRPSMKFPYPDEAYYQRLRRGEELDSGAMGLLQNEGITLRELEVAVRTVFCKIAVPFSPHKSANIRQAELVDLMKHCRLREKSSRPTSTRDIGMSRTATRTMSQRQSRAINDMNSEQSKESSRTGNGSQSSKSYHKGGSSGSLGNSEQSRESAGNGSQSSKSYHKGGSSGSLGDIVEPARKSTRFEQDVNRTSHDESAQDLDVIAESSMEALRTSKSAAAEIKAAGEGDDKCGDVYSL